MASHKETLDALVFVLCAKVYPLKPPLMRNDSLTASLILDYIWEITEYHYASEHVALMKRTRFQREVDDAFYRIYPLIGLSSNSIRKYVSEVWQTGKVTRYVKFKEVKPFNL